MSSEDLARLVDRLGVIRDALAKGTPSRHTNDMAATTLELEMLRLKKYIECK